MFEFKFTILTFDIHFQLASSRLFAVWPVKHCCHIESTNRDAICRLLHSPVIPPGRRRMYMPPFPMTACTYYEIDLWGKLEGLLVTGQCVGWWRFQLQQFWCWLAGSQLVCLPDWAEETARYFAFETCTANNRYSTHSSVAHLVTTSFTCTVSVI